MRAAARVWGLPLALGAAGLLLVLAATARYGAGLTPDSGCYLSAARSLAAGKGFLPYSGNPFVEWPPLFPALLAVPALLGGDPSVAARYLNAAVFGLILLVSGLWMRRNIRSPLVTGIGAAALLLAVPVQEVASFAWSEPLFILLALLFLREIQAYGAEARRRSLYLAAIYAALACLTRYIGVTLLLTGAAAILTYRKTDLRVRVRTALGWGVVAAAPLGAWLVRNYAVSATWLGKRAPATTTHLSQNVGYTLDNISGWFLPESLPVLPRCLIFALLVALIALAARRATRQPGRAPSGRPSGAAGPVAVFLLSYSGWLIASVSAVELTILDTRYWAPAYLPLVFLCLLALDALAGPPGLPDAAPVTSRHGGRKSRHRSPAPNGRTLPHSLSATVLAAGCALLIAQPGCNTLRGLRFCRANGYVHDRLLVSDGGENAKTAAECRQSEIVTFLRAHPVPGRLYSNNPVVYYLLSGSAMRMLPLLPAPQYRREYVSQELLGLQEESRRNGPFHVAWFDRTLYEVYGPDDLKEYFDVQLVARKRDGAVYRLAPRRVQMGSVPRAND